MARTLVGTRIRERRRDKGFTQSALAKTVGISAPYLNLIEHNRRGIAGRTLSALADALEIPLKELAEGADQTLLDRLLEAAQSDPSVLVEADRLEEFVGRFPGWARLLKRLRDQTVSHGDDLAALSDQINRDPYFSEAMHLMLSNITAIRSTAEILTEGDALPETMRDRFIGNLYKEVLRLSDSASDILNHFDSQSTEISISDDKAPSETFWSNFGFFSEALEHGGEIDPVGPDPRLKRDLSLYRDMADAIPVDTLTRAVDAVGYNPLALAHQTKTPLNLVFRRLAHAPQGRDAPEFGLMECDMAGGVLFRKPLSSLALPRRSGGCPLWPIHAVAARPGEPLRSLIKMPSGEVLLTFSVATQEPPSDYHLPAQQTLSMLFTPDISKILERSERDTLPIIAVGAQCSICPRTDCRARRDGFILG